MKQFYSDSLKLKDLAFVLSHWTERPILVLAKDETLKSPVRDLARANLELQDVLEESLLCHASLDFQILTDHIIIYDTKLLNQGIPINPWTLDLAHASGELDGVVETNALDVLSFLCRHFKKTLTVACDQVPLLRPLPFLMEQGDSWATVLKRFSELLSLEFQLFENTLDVWARNQKILPKAPTVTAIL